MATAVALEGIACPFKAVAEYPPTLPYIGQDTAYHRLFGFTESIRDEEQAHFLALFGDWAIGKSRMAHELIAQFCGQSRGWTLTDGTQTAPLLRPLTEGGDVVPLFVSFVDALNFEHFGIDTGTAMGKLTCTAAAFLPDTQLAHGSHYHLYKAVRDALRQANVNFDFDRLTAIATDTSRSYTERAAQIVALLNAMTGGRVKRVLVIVDEVESAAENPFADEIGKVISNHPIPPRAVRDLYEAVKDATNTNAYPALNFLFFNTITSRRLANMESLDRRMMTANLEQASATDLERLIDAIRRSGYPLEGMLQDLAQRAFFAADRNFGWFSFIMNKAHFLLLQKPQLGVGQIFAEVCKRTGKVFQPDVFEDRDIQPPALKDAMRQVIYNQVPATLTSLGLDPALLQGMLTYQDPFQTHFVGEAAHVAVSADQLTTALLQTGLYDSEPQPYLTGEASVRFDPAEILGSLRTFTWESANTGAQTSARLWVYLDAADFENQVSFAYPKFGQDLSPATVRTIHKVLLERFQPDQAGGNRRLVAPTMALLRRFNDLWGKAAANNWLPEADWERVVKETEAYPEKNDTRLLTGIANVLFDASQIVQSPYPDVRAQSLTLRLESHVDYNVTARNQLVLLKARETPQGIMEDLRAIKQRVPVFLIFGRADDRDAWERHIRERHEEEVAIAAITYVVEPQTRAWEFYVRYSLRDTPEGFKFDAPTRKGKDLRDEFRDVLHERFREWLDGVEQRGYVLRPFSLVKSATSTQFRDFARGWAELLRAGSVAALGSQASAILKSFEDYERERQSDTLQLTAGEGATRRAVIPAVLPHLLDVLRIQPRKLAELTDEVFFARSSRAVSFPTSGALVLEQLLALAREIGVVETDEQERYVVRTVASFNTRFDQAFQRLGTLEGASSGYAAQVHSLSGPVQALAGQLDVNEHQLTLLRSQKLRPEQEQLAQLPLDRLTSIPPDQAAFVQVARGVGAVADALGEVLGKSGQNTAPPPIDPQTLQDNITHIAADKGFHEFSIEYRVTFLKQLETYLSETERELRERLAQMQASLTESSATVAGNAAFPVRPLGTLLDGAQADLDGALPGNALPLQLRQQPQDAPLSVLKGAGRLSDVLLKLAWYSGQLDEQNRDGWWVRYTTAREQWQATRTTYDQVDQAWQSLERYFDGTAPEHRRLFTGTELSGDIRDLDEQVATFSGQFDDPKVSLDELANEIEEIRKQCATVEERIQAARNGADKEIETLLNETNDGVVGQLAQRLNKSNILPDPKRVLGAHTHQDAHVALDQYQRKITEAGASLCDGRPELYERYLQIARDVKAGMTGEQIIQRHGEQLVREMSDRKLLTLRYTIEL